MRLAIVAVGLSAVASGCASLAPPASTTTTTTATTTTATPSTTTATAATGAAAARSPVARAQATHEYPGPAPPRQSAPGAGTATEAVAAFATAYINWNAHTVAADMEALAGASLGQARSAMELAAAQTGSDYELQRGGIANSGVVEAVASLPGTRAEYIVVTREQTTATATDAYQGLQPAWHIAIATVTQVAAGRWAVSGWQPQS